jgi:hypothetical protein
MTTKDDEIPGPPWITLAESDWCAMTRERDALQAALKAALEQNARFAAEIALLRVNRDLVGDFLRVTEEMLFRSSEGRLFRIERVLASDKNG